MNSQVSRKRFSTITMREVAKQAGVSQSTVSRVLNDAKGKNIIPISEETHKRVMEAVEQLGYRMNVTARSLRTQRTFLLAAMIPDISNAFYHAVIRTVQHVARTHGYDVLLFSTDQEYENEQHFCEAILRRPVDGVIMVPYHLTADEIDQVVEQTNAAVVALGQHVDHPFVDVVFADDEAATRKAVSWLIFQKGHNQIGFIGVPESFPPGVRRWRGYVHAMREANLPVNMQHVETSDFTAEGGRQAMQTILSRGNPPSAVFVCNDRMALGAMYAAQDAGFRVPDQIAVVGFDNIPEATLIRPNLTTVAQFPEAIGQQLGTALFERIDSPDMLRKRYFEIPCQLIERDSA